MEAKITLSKENREELIAYIQDYFFKERDEELGDLAAGFILDFVLEKIGPVIYNQGIEDVYKYLETRNIDILELKIS